MGKHLQYTWFAIRMAVIMFQGWIPGCIAQNNFCKTRNEQEIFKAKVKALNVRHFQNRSVKEITEASLHSIG